MVVMRNKLIDVMKKIGFFVYLKNELYLFI